MRICRDPGANVIPLGLGGCDKQQCVDRAGFNEGGADIDFRVEGTGKANALFVQGSDGYVGVNTNSPSQLLDVESGTVLVNYNTNALFDCEIVRRPCFRAVLQAASPQPSRFFASSFVRRHPG